MNPKYFLPIILCLALLFSFWKLGSNDVSEWDEAEYGTIAYEMLHNGDYVNYYYAGSQDTRNGKPPLMIWLIILSYKAFGYNAFALRFTSALSSIGFFFFGFKIMTLYRDKKFALITSLILLSCKVIIGFHVGRTGDTDALLVFFITAAVYFYLLYTDFNKRNAIIISTIFLGFAFYTKGPAAFVLIPGMLLYSIFRRKLSKTLLDSKTWIGIIVMLLICSSWIFLLMTKGNVFKSDTSWYGSNNAIETLFSHDTFARLTDPNFEQNRKPDHFFFFSVLDIRFNLWNYIFYLSILCGIIAIVKNPKSLINITQETHYRFITFSICMIFPYSILLTFAATKHDWYIAPMALYIVVIITEGLVFIGEKYKWMHVIWIGILGFSLGRQFIIINSPKDDMASFFIQNKSHFENSSITNIIHYPTQNFFLYLTWNSKQIKTAVNTTKSFAAGDLIVFDDSVLNIKDIPNVHMIDCYNHCCVASVQE